MLLEDITKILVTDYTICTIETPSISLEGQIQ